MAIPNPLIGIIARVAMGAVTETAKRSDNKMSATAVANAKPDIVEAMKEAVAASPEVQHLTNTETFWRKRTFWATIAGLGTALGTGAIYISEKLSAGGEASELSLTLIIGALWAAYSSFRAGTATKPLGK